MDLKVLGLHEKHVDRNQLVLVFFFFFGGGSLLLIRRSIDQPIKGAGDIGSDCHWPWPTLCFDQR